jgi:membrane protein Man1
VCSDNGCESFLAKNHIRDTLIPPQDRKKKEALWNKVAEHISQNESRIREEVQHVMGEEFRVWRYISSASPLVARKRLSTAPTSGSTLSSGGGSTSTAPSPGLYPTLDGLADDLNAGGSSDPDSPWQGQAFEVAAGSPNALANIPTPCLKIRQMYDINK